jgi:adenine-specific DNA-methyltransferase
MFCPLTLINPQVYKIEAEIEALYHSHFAIQRRDQKLALQKKIKDLRNELGILLTESLGSSKKAQHIADWDPFDPQATSDFFDPHWMFGPSLAKGFDIVFGNPSLVFKSTAKPTSCWRKSRPNFMTASSTARPRH